MGCRFIVNYYYYYLLPSDCSFSYCILEVAIFVFNFGLKGFLHLCNMDYCFVTIFATDHKEFAIKLVDSYLFDVKLCGQSCWHFYYF